jgi:hypothetical protein
MNLLKSLRSNQFALFIAILSVIVQSFHSFTAFYATSSLQNGWGIAQAVLFALVIDLAILFYTVRGRRDIAMYAAVAMVMINGYYYYQHLGITFQFAFGCFLSLIIPISVYFYSEEIKDDDGENSLRHYRIMCNDLAAANQDLKKERDEIAKRLDEVTDHSQENQKLLSDVKAYQSEINRLSLIHKEQEVSINKEIEHSRNMSSMYSKLLDEREALLAELGRPVKTQADNTLLNVHEDQKEPIGKIPRVGGNKI